MNGTLYSVGDATIEVPSSPLYETTLSIPAVILAGIATSSGRPLREMNIAPSEPRPRSFGCAVSLDEYGRFEFPLPQPGKWDLVFWGTPHTSSGRIRGAQFDEADAASNITITLPEGTITRHPR